MIIFHDIRLIDQHFNLLEHHDVAVEQGLIRSITPTAPRERYPAAAEFISGSNCVLLPGLFNLHTHVPMTLLRGYGENLPLQRWLHEKIFPFEDLMDETDMYWGSLLGIAEMLACGTVSFSDMYMKVPGIVQAVAESGIKANLSHSCAAPGQAVDFSRTNSYQGTRYLLDYVRAHPHTLIKADASLHAEYTSEEVTVRSLAEFTRAHQLIVQVHLSETAREHRECQARRSGRTPAEYLRDCGLFDIPAVCAHGVYTEAEDLDILRDKGAFLVHNPASNLKLGSGFADLRQWQEHQVTTCIGTDGAASNNNLNLLEDMRLASLLQKGLQHDPTFLDPASVLRLATLNGALAQGRPDSGRIEPGCAADLVLFNLDRPQTLPVYDPLANILYSADNSNVELTMVQGRILYRSGEYLSLDIERIRFEAERIKREKLAALS